MKIMPFYNVKNIEQKKIIYEKLYYMSIDAIYNKNGNDFILFESYCKTVDKYFSYDYHNKDHLLSIIIGIIMLIDNLHVFCFDGYCNYSNSDSDCDECYISKKRIISAKKRGYDVIKILLNLFDNIDPINEIINTTNINSGENCYYEIIYKDEGLKNIFLDINSDCKKAYQIIP